MIEQCPDKPKSSSNRALRWLIILSTCGGAGILAALIFGVFSLHVPPIRHTQITPSNDSAQLLFVGDTHFAEDYFARRDHWQARNVLEQFGYEYPMARLKSLVGAADLVVANLETPLSERSRGAEGFGSMKYLHWTVPDEVLPVLSAQNVGAVSLGNNHVFDAGLPGFRETVDHLSRAGIASFGAGMSEADASEPYRVSIRYGSQVLQVAVIGAYWYRSSFDEKHDLYAYEERPGVRDLEDGVLIQQIGELARETPRPYIIVFPHWGKNYRWKNDVQTQTAHALIDAGADLIIGHGAHHFQEVELYNRRWILYNLGNFMFLTPGLYERKNAHPYSLAAGVIFKPSTDGQPVVRVRLYVLFSDNRESDLQTYLVSGDKFREAVTLMQEASSKISEDPVTFTEGKDDVGAFIDLRVMEEEASTAGTGQ